MIVAVATLIAGLIGLVITGSAIVSGASTIGLRIGLPLVVGLTIVAVIGLTVLAVGTSAPEIATSAIAALGHPRRGRTGPTRFPDHDRCRSALHPDRTDRLAIARGEGFAFVGLYAGYTAFLVLDGLDERSAPIIGTITLAAIVPILALTVRTLTMRQQPPNQPGAADHP